MRRPHEVARTTADLASHLDGGASIGEAFDRSVKGRTSPTRGALISASRAARMNPDLTVGGAMRAAQNPEVFPPLLVQLVEVGPGDKVVDRLREASEIFEREAEERRADALDLLVAAGGTAIVAGVVAAVAGSIFWSAYPTRPVSVPT